LTSILTFIAKQTKKENAEDSPALDLILTRSELDYEVYKDAFVSYYHAFDALKTTETLSGLGSYHRVLLLTITSGLLLLTY